MRTWFYNLLINLGLPGSPPAHSAGSGNDLSGHFIIIAMGPERPPLGMPAESRTFQQTVDFWVHDTPGSMLKIDEACLKIKNEMPTKAPATVGGLSVYEVHYDETSGDAYDDQWGTNTRRVSFTVTCRR